MVDLCWAPPLQVLVRADPVELIAPDVQRGLLGGRVDLNVSGDLCVDVTMHARMRSVILRMSRAAMFQLDPQGDPLGRQTGQPERGRGTGERRSVVAFDDLREAILLEQRSHLLSDRSGAGVGGYMRSQDESTARIP